MAQHAAIVGAAERHRRHALRAGGGGELRPAGIDGGMGKAVRGIDQDDPGARAGDLGQRLTVDLAAAQMLGIDGHVHQPVAADPVALGETGGAGNRERLSRGRPRAHERLAGEVLDRIEIEM